MLEESGVMNMLMKGYSLSSNNPIPAHMHKECEDNVKAFAVFAVEYLWMPMVAMPLYSEDASWKKKAARILSFVLEVGTLGTWSQGK